jgi:hypothetical protein
MHTPPPMPQFNKVPLLGQRQPPNQQQLQSQIQAAIGQLSMNIYTQVAESYIFTEDDEHRPVNRDQFRQLAKDSQIAALCYFEGIGIIQQNKETQE